jgi:hypothetical protein
MTSFSARRGVPAVVVALVVSLAMGAGPSPAVESPPSEPESAPGPRPSPLPDAWTTRSILTSEFGVRRPTGVTWDAARKTLLVTGAVPAGGSKIVGVTPDERRRGQDLVADLEDDAAVAYDPRTGRLTVWQQGRRSVVQGSELEPRGLSRPRTRQEVADVSPAGATFTADGTWSLLDGEANAIVSVAADGAVSTVPLSGVEGAELRGLAYQPREDLLYVADVSGDELLAVDESGRVVKTQSLVDAGIDDLQDMTFAPSSDTTDPAGEQSLYVADAGTTERLGRIAEVSLQAAPAPLEATVTAEPSTVTTTDTSLWSPPSPDPSGVTYIPASDRLLVSDGEVDEMPLYQGANLFTALRTGSKALESTGTTLVPTAWSAEPTGVELVSATGRLFVSDDDKKTVFEIADAGADNVFGTADDGTRTSLRTSTFGSTDPEGVAYDTQRDELLIVDGLSNEFYRLSAGSNGRFDGVPPAGDDVARQFDLERLGLHDPEGITYDAVRDTVVVLDDRAIWEIDENGSLLNTVSLSTVPVDAAAGITIAPASSGGGRNYFFVDRGVDNNSDPSENDGRLFEVAASLPSVLNRPPAVEAGPAQLATVGEPVQLSGSATDDGKPAPLTYRWTKQSGPGQVNFADATAATTTATFSVAGTYRLRLTASDSQLTGFDEVEVDIFAPGGPRTVALPLAAGSDDATEGTVSGGDFVSLTRADNELGQDINGGTLFPVHAGLRFQGIPVPREGEILSARIQFAVDETSSGASSLTIRGEAADNATTFQATGGNISSRPTTSAAATWQPPAWTTVGAAGPGQRTSELSSILQEIVDRPGWSQGNAAVFIVTGSGRRTAEAFDGRGGPVLLLEYRLEPPPVSVSLDASLSRLVEGGDVRLTGQVVRGSSVLAGQDVELHATTGPDGAKSTLGTVTTAADGSFTFRHQPRANTWFTAVTDAATSEAVRVRVAPRVAAWLTHTRIGVGTRTSVMAAVTRALEGQPLRLQRWNGTRWRTIRTAQLPAGDRVRKRFTLRLVNSGVRRFRVVAPPYGGRTGTTVPSGRRGLVVRVFRAEISRVKPAGDEFVTVRNTGAVNLQLRDWRLRNAANGRLVRLPSFTVRPGRLVRVHTGAGASDRNDLYLAKGRMWGSHGKAVLRDHLNRLVDRFRY